MINSKTKIALCLLVAVLNVAFLFWLRHRRANVANLPPGMQTWQPLAEWTAEEREQVVASAFALDDFAIKPLATESESVTIPRPENWFEQMIVSTSYVNAGPSESEDDQAAGDSKSDDSTLPQRTEVVNVNIISISLARYETVPTPETEPTPATVQTPKTEPMPEGGMRFGSRLALTVLKALGLERTEPTPETVLTPENNLIRINEKLNSRDGHMTSNGAEVPLVQFVAAGRYFVDEKDNTLPKRQRAIQINGTPRIDFKYDVPYWLVPMQKLAIGETWEQVGPHPSGLPGTGTRPKAVRTLNRLVMFEGRRAAEISSTSTIYDFSPGLPTAQIRREEESLTYLDLETGEPL